jgi:hypothetical protein
VDTGPPLAAIIGDTLAIDLEDPALPGQDPSHLAPGTSWPGIRLVRAAAQEGAHNQDQPQGEC